MSTEEENDFKISRVIGNEIFYYGEITDVDILEFIEDFKKLEICWTEMSIEQQARRAPFAPVKACLGKKGESQGSYAPSEITKG